MTERGLQHASNEKAEHLRTLLRVFEAGAPLPLWLAAVPLRLRKKLCTSMLVDLGIGAVAAGTAEMAALPSAVANFCTTAQSLFGCVGALWPLAPQALTQDCVSTASPLHIILAEPVVADLLKPLCTAVLSALRVIDGDGSSQQLWPLIRSAVPPDDACGTGLLPTDILIAFFLCHYMTDLKLHGGANIRTPSIAPEVASRFASLLQVALRDAPAVATPREGAKLEEGFATILDRPWPQRSVLDTVTGLPPTPTRFPIILSACEPASSTEALSSLRQFLRALDRA